ncbi:LPS-assembly protein LptD [Lysobacter sp. TY2-98]|uniref:LPS assembly protein LptD n=1 Tax=Lysobacter sp. TY2-98 TaxID=2290922 RepID=UPI000E20332E|nr:LPS assembly protein LptD [Lysobacter sp. TY2-98]AXK71115.1 LPS-assembly protein LptD [Lysobacter sp. TY2-98]
MPRVRPTLRLLPLSLCIAIALPAMAAEEKEDWSLCPLRDAVPAFEGVATPASGDTATRVTQPTDIEGDTLQGSESTDTLVQGNVQLRRGDQFLGTDRLIYNQTSGDYKADGSVRYQDSGMRIVAKSAEGNQESDTHTINDLQYQLMRRRGNGGAEKIALKDQNGALYGGTYSTCDPGQRAWELRAKEIDIDLAKGRGVAHNATLRVGKVPVLYVPWFAFPTDDRRQTGLLYPSISSSNRNGFDWKQPIYINIAPNYDATLYPRYMSKRGLHLGAEFRWLYEQGSGSVYGAWMPKDDLPGRRPERYLEDLNGNPIPGATLPDSNRGQFGLTAIHNINSTFYASANLGWVSDTHYLEDFSNSLYGVSSYFVHSETGVFGRGRYWNAGLAADHYQLADYTLSDANLPYDRLPRLYGHWAQPFGRWLEAGVDGEMVRFQHVTYSGQNGQFDGSRLDLKPYVAANFDGASWFVHPKLAWRYTGWQLDNDWQTRALQPLTDLSPSRSLPISTLDAGMYFDRSTSVLGTRYLQTFEPRLFYLNVPYRDQNGIPLFDTAPMTFSWGQLFRDNRYTGPDRQTDANQLTVAATTRFISESDGRERLSVSLGQIRYFEDSRVIIDGAESPVSQGKSAWVLESSFSPSDRWLINGAYQWDPKIRGQDLASLRARYLVGDRGILNFGYRYRRNTTFNPAVAGSQPDLVRQADVSFLYPITDNWSVVGRYYYSILDHKPLEEIAGVQWESCCLAVRAVGRRYLRDRTGDLNNSIQLEVELKGLGSAGQKASRVLRRAILGYDRDDLYLVPPQTVSPPVQNGTSTTSDSTP